MAGNLKRARVSHGRMPQSPPLRLGLRPRHPRSTGERNPGWRRAGMAAAAFLSPVERGRGGLRSKPEWGSTFPRESRCDSPAVPAERMGVQPGSIRSPTQWGGERPVRRRRIRRAGGTTQGRRTPGRCEAAGTRLVAPRSGDGEGEEAAHRRWRHSLASVQLRLEDKALAAIADAAGDGTEAAFNRAFSRRFGSPPAEWRRTRPG